MALKTDYKDDVIANGGLNRKYNMITNEDGTVSFEDVTEYEVVGDFLRGVDVNDITSSIGNLEELSTEDKSSLVGSIVELSNKDTPVTVQGGVLSSRGTGTATLVVSNKVAALTVDITAKVNISQGQSIATLNDEYNPLVWCIGAQIYKSSSSGDIVCNKYTPAGERILETISWIIK